MDWKEQLAALNGLPEGEETAPQAPAEPQQEQGCGQKGVLHVVVEKKGRGGKTATIIEGFDCPDEAIDEIARELRRRLGTGGSARGGEILIQGDLRDDVLAFLHARGLKAK